MLAMRELWRPLGDLTVLWPNCGRPMHLTIPPRAGGVSDLRTFRCGECGVSLTEAAPNVSGPEMLRLYSAGAL